jgi:hypothetical protein
MADFGGSLSQIDVCSSDSMQAMRYRWLLIIGALLVAGAVSSTPLVAQPAQGTADKPYARIAILRPHDGDTVDFEAGYIRHLEFHRQAKDTWTWYGWTIWAGDRQRWFVYATFGHAAADFDSPVSPTEDERDNISNVTPHAEFVGNAVYEYRPELSRGTGVPTPTARLELTTVDVEPGRDKAFEAALGASAPTAQGETLWYRMVAGGIAPRYVRLRPRLSLSAILDGRSEQVLPDGVNAVIAKTTVEILNLRPTMSYGLPARE